MIRLPGAGRARRAIRVVAGGLRRRSPRGVILLYHRVAGPRFDPLLLDVSPANFDGQMAVVVRDATPLPLDEFEALRRAGALPERAVAVTFDDGYADNLHAAAPVLARHGVPATVFTVSGMVGARGEFWWDDLERIVFVSQPLPGWLPLKGIHWRGDSSAGAPPLGWNVEAHVRMSSRQGLYLRLVEAVRLLAPAERAEVVAKLRAWAGVGDEGRPSHRTLTAGELGMLAESTGITIGAHTVTHPVLALLDAHAQRRELAESRAQLETATGRVVRFVAYPYGTRADVSGTTTRAARAAGFDAAFANEASCAWRASNRWRVPRILVRDWDATEFARRLAGWWSL